MEIYGTACIIQAYIFPTGYEYIGTNPKFSQVIELLNAAAFLQLAQLQEDAERHCESLLTPDNVLEIAHVAEALTCPRLQERVLHFQREHFSALWQTPEFLDLPLEKVRSARVCPKLPPAHKLDGSPWGQTSCPTSDLFISLDIHNLHLVSNILVHY
jgi:hypothetical protein